MSAEQMKMLTTSGVEVLSIDRGSEAASAIGQHWNAVKSFLHTGKTTELEPFSLMRIRDYRFATDPAWIVHWATAGELDFEEIYESGWS